MMLRALFIGGLIAIGIAAAPGADAAEFAVSSPAFADNTPIPAEYSCNGRNVLPPLHWENVPDGTESLALVVDDPDAAGGLYVHWVVTGIPPRPRKSSKARYPEELKSGSTPGARRPILAHAHRRAPACTTTASSCTH